MNLQKLNRLDKTQSHLKEKRKIIQENHHPVKGYQKQSFVQALGKFWASKPHNIIKDDKTHISCENHGQSMRHKQNNNIVKLLKKWKVKGKGTVRNQIIEGNAKTLENKRLRNHRIIKKLIKSVYFMAKKHCT